MKKMFLVFSLVFGVFNLNAMFAPDYHLIWLKTKQKLVRLGMNEEDLDGSVSKDYPLDKLELTNFWKEKKQSSQDGKNKLLAKILSLPYADKWNILRLHIAASIIVGAHPDTAEYYPQNLGDPSLDDACFEQDIPLVSLLLKKGADPNIRTSIAILSCVSHNKNEQLARLLLAYGADPGKQQTSGWDFEKKRWCKNIQLQMQKEQEDGLKFLAAKALLKHQSIGVIKNLPTPPPADVIGYLEETKKMLN